MATITVYNKSGDVQQVDESNLDKAAVDGYVRPVTVTKGNDKQLVHPDNLQAAVKDGYKPASEMGENFLGSDENKIDTLKGVTAGATLGGQNMLGGAIQSGLDLGQSALHNIGLASASPSQVGADLKAKGTTGDIGPTSTEDMYYKGKHETSDDFDASQKRSPWLYGAGQLAGGAALPLGALGAAKNASTAAKIGVGAATGLGLGAATGFLSGKSDLGGENANPEGVAKETAIGGAIGLPLGAAGSAIGAGLENAQGGLKKFASNRAAAAVGVNADVNAQKNVGGALLQNNALPFGGPKKVQAVIQNKIDDLENQLTPILEDATNKLKGKSSGEENQFLEKFKQYKKFLDAQKQLAKHADTIDQVNLPGLTDELQSTVQKPINVPVGANKMATGPITPNVQTNVGQPGLPGLNNDLQATANVPLNVPLNGRMQGQAEMPNVIAEPGQMSLPMSAPEGQSQTSMLGGDLQGSSQQTQNIPLQGHLNAKGSVPGIVQGEGQLSMGLGDELSQTTNGAQQVPLQGHETVPAEVPGIVAHQGQMDMGLDGGLNAPIPTQGVVNKQQLVKNFDNIIGQATKGLNQTPEDQAIAQKLTSGMDDFRNQIENAGNDPMALNDIKRRLYAQIKQMSKTAYAPGGESVGPKIAVYKNIANMLKTQVEGLADQIEPGLGKRISDINNEMGSFLQANQGIDETAGNLSLTDVMKPKSAASKLLTGNPITTNANIGLARGANALSDINASGVTAPTTSALTSKAVQGSIYKRHQDQYRDYSNKLMSNPQTAHLGKALGDALNSNNQLSQTQALFVIQQNPQARKVIDGGQ